MTRAIRTTLHDVTPSYDVMTLHDITPMELR